MPDSCEKVGDGFVSDIKDTKPSRDKRTDAQQPYDEYRVRASKKAMRRIARNRKEHHTLLLRIFLVLIAFFFLMNLVTRDRDFSPQENRTLAQKPKITLSALNDGSYFSDISSWYNDQFFMRDTWMTLNYRFHSFLGEREFNQVYVGKKGYLLNKPEEMEPQWASSLSSAMASFAGAYPSIRISMITVPSAACILEEKRPAGVIIPDQNAMIEKLYASLPESLHKVNPYSVLKENSDQYIYYKTDHHWTSLGALTVFRYAAEALDLNLSNMDYSNHTVSDTFQGTLSSRSGNHNSKDTIEVYEPVSLVLNDMYIVNYPDLKKRSRSIFVKDQLKEKDQYTVFFGGNHARIEIRTISESERNLLILKDSYANSFVQFLTPFYSNIVIIDPRYYYNDLSTLMRSSAITDVLILYSADTLFADTALIDTLSSITVSGTSETGSGDAGQTAGL